MGFLKNALSKKWFISATAGVLLAGAAALPAEAGDHGHHRGQQGGFHGGQQRVLPRQQMQRRQPIQQFNQHQYRPDPQLRQIQRMQRQVHSMNHQAELLQRQMEMQRFHQMQQRQLMRRYQFNNNVYRQPYPAAPIYQGPTQQDYDMCVDVQEQAGGCFIDNNGGIHYTQPQGYRRDNGAEAATVILNMLKIVNDAAQRQQLQDQLQTLELKKQQLELQRDQEIQKQGGVIPEPTVDQGDLNEYGEDDSPDAAANKALRAPAPQ